MDVSAEAADLVVKEGLQATETAVKLAGSGIKNVAALLLALSKQDYKVIGQASAARLARDPNPPAVVQIRAEDLSRFRKMAAKQYGPQARGRQRPYYHRFDADLCRKSQLYYGRAGLPRAGQGGGRAKKSSPPRSVRESLERAREYLDSIAGEDYG